MFIKDPTACCMPPHFVIFQSYFISVSPPMNVLNLDCLNIDFIVFFFFFFFPSCESSGTKFDEEFDQNRSVYI